MGTICAGQGVITLPNPSKSRMALSYKLDQGSPICAEPAESFYNFYHLHSQVVGIGSVSQVSVCSKIASSKQRAVKIISKLALPVHIISTNTLQTNFAKLKDLKSGRLLKLYQIFESKDSFYVVSEYLDQGNLSELLESGPLPETKALAIVSQLLEALVLLDDKGIQVLDFRAENVLFSDLNRLQVKLNVFRTHYCETEDKTRFTCPEFKTGKSLNKATSWSLGMVTLCMLFGLEQPKDQDFHYLSLEAQEFLEKLLEKDPEKRLSLKEASQLNWVKVSS